MNENDFNEINDEINKAENEEKFLLFKTELLKKSFINEMKEGLGKEIKSTPTKFTVIKRSRWYRFRKKLKPLIINLFSKF